VNAVKEMIDSIVSSLSRRPPNTGLVVAAIRGDDRSVFGYGKVTDAGAEPPGGDTLFRIGSITKVFTTTLLSVLTADGVVSLDDPIRNLVPGLSNLPPEITLFRLATHTSGLPMMPSNLGRSMRQNRRNPYGAYTTAQLLEYVSNYKPNQNRKSTAQPNYSNLGMALLGYILAQEIGTSYEQAVVGRICDALDLPDTCITLSPEQKERLAAPHKANGKPTQSWELPAFAGAGALGSTAYDMLKFLAANLGRPHSALTEVLQVCHRVRAESLPRPGRLQRLAARLFQKQQDMDDYRQGMALGWYVGRLHSGGRQVHWHHGATGGYRAFAGFVKSSDTGVAVLANREPGKLDLLLNKTDADDIGFRVLEHLNSSHSSHELSAET
jgi:D-alanyl-D-alanine-carboxypeptidase/D-alanyl-D-alanine-endopeptidase